MIIDNEWYIQDKEEFHAKLSSLGFYDISSYFSHSFSQGDGACFEAKYSFEPNTPHIILNELQEKYGDSLEATITTSSSNYLHEETMRLELHENEETEKLTEDKFCEVENYLLNLCKLLAKEYFVQIRETYDNIS